MWNQKYTVVRRTSPAGIPRVWLSFLLVSDDRTSEISNPGMATEWEGMGAHPCPKSSTLTPAHFLTIST